MRTTGLNTSAASRKPSFHLTFTLSIVLAAGCASESSTKSVPTTAAVKPNALTTLFERVPATGLRRELAEVAFVDLQAVRKLNKAIEPSDVSPLLLELDRITDLPKYFGFSFDDVQTMAVAGLAPYYLRVFQGSFNKAKMQIAFEADPRWAKSLHIDRYEGVEYWSWNELPLAYENTDVLRHVGQPLRVALIDQFLYVSASDEPIHRAIDTAKRRSASLANDASTSPFIAELQSSAILSGVIHRGAFSARAAMPFATEAQRQKLIADAGSPRPFLALLAGRSIDHPDDEILLLNGGTAALAAEYARVMDSRLANLSTFAGGGAEGTRYTELFSKWSITVAGPLTIIELSPDTPGRTRLPNLVQSRASLFIAADI
jgi:hypothetical protein